MDYKEAKDAAIDIAKDAGKLLMAYTQKTLAYNEKSSTIDIVTEADQAAEVLIVERLKALFPEHHIQGEEGGHQGAASEGADYTWHVDPIDGTTNYAHGIPYFCTSIALATSACEPVVGVIYAPVADELYVAVKGEGATCNSEPIHVSDRTRLGQCVVVSGFPYDRQTNPDNNIAEWTAFAPRVRGLRRMGSAAMDLAYVASGRTDGYWERGLKTYDALAGVLLVQEAGGIVSDYAGQPKPQDRAEGRYLASNGRIHQQMVDILMSARQK